MRRRLPFPFVWWLFASTGWATAQPVLLLENQFNDAAELSQWQLAFGQGPVVWSATEGLPPGALELRLGANDGDVIWSPCFRADGRDDLAPYAISVSQRPRNLTECSSILLVFPSDSSCTGAYYEDYLVRQQVAEQWRNGSVTYIPFPSRNESFRLVFGGRPVGLDSARVCLLDNVVIRGPFPIGPCGIVSSNEHCLRGRFRIRATFRAPGETTRPATAYPITSDTGAFWFFREGNLELVIKVLDGCPVNGRRWVFATGLTNVEVELTTTDVVTGESFVIRNPQGTPFQPVLETSALAGCP